MDRNEMIEVLANAAGLKKAEANRVYDALVQLAKDKLMAGDDFVLPGLGALKVKEQKAREARNPRTGDLVHVPAKKAVRFTAYKQLKETMNPPAPEAPCCADQPAPCCTEQPAPAPEAPAAPEQPAPPEPGPATPPGGQPY